MTAGGAPKSGSPMLSLTTSCPCAARAAARLPNSMARNGAIACARREIFMPLPPRFLAFVHLSAVIPSSSRRFERRPCVQLDVAEAPHLGDQQGKRLDGR